MRWVYALPALVLASAGCLSSGTSSDANDANDLVAEPALPELETVVHEWRGRIVAGALFEGPAHFRETEPHVAPLWRSGFVLEVTEQPQDFQVSIDWTGTGSLQIMVHTPHEHADPDEKGWPEYVTAFSGDKHQCLRLPADALHTGRYYIMMHTQYGANVEALFKAHLLGGAAQVLDGPHGHATNADEGVRAFYTITGQPNPSEACDEGVGHRRPPSFPSPLPPLRLPPS